MWLLAQEVSTDISGNGILSVAGIVAAGVALNQLLNVYSAYRKKKLESDVEEHNQDKKNKLDELEIEERRDEVEAKRVQVVKAEALARLAIAESQIVRLQADHMECVKEHSRCEERVKGLEEACNERDDRMTKLETKLDDVVKKYTTLKVATGRSGTEIQP